MAPSSGQLAPAKRGKWLWWTIAIVVWWTLDGFTDVMNYRAMAPPGGPGMDRIWRAYMLSAWLWIPLTLVALWLARRFPLGAGPWATRLTIQLAGAVLACVARAVAVVQLNPAVGWYAKVPPFGEVLLTSFANNFFPYLMLVGVGHAIVYAERVRERDDKLARAELRALKQQLQPHFLFNTLNTINTYVRADPDVAQRMIARLSDLLRRVLDTEGVQEVTLDEELAMVRAYLDIEQVRFEERLSVQWNIDASARDAWVPHLVLQPLVENAIRHGIAPRANAGTLEVRARRYDSTLALAVRDDGVGLRTGDASGGRGLSNTRDRLRQLYGERQRVEVTAPPTGGFLVELTIPYRARRAATA